MDKRLTYAYSGVDIEAGYEVVRRIRPLAAATHRAEVLSGIGSFGSFFALDSGKYKEPVLVAGTDGVGTKLKIAFMLDKHDTIGIDAVAYCVNDVICQGAEPLFFLDYLAFDKVIPEKVEAIVRGLVKGCTDAGCALVGGETAEMPGMYGPGEYDLAGFTVGVADRANIINGSTVQAGSKIIGLRSTGLQSSGFSLVRHICFNRKGYSPDLFVAEFGKTLGEELLTPTAVYVKGILGLLPSVTVQGIANISGGGLPENLPRSMAPGLDALIDGSKLNPHPIFNFLQREGDLSDEEMFRTFNMGVGMAVIVDDADIDEALRILQGQGVEAAVIGEVAPGQGRVQIRGRQVTC